MTKRYVFTEATIAYETFLYYNLEGASVPEHRDIIQANEDKLRIVPYTHQFPTGTESICYNIQGFAPLERTFRKRQLNFEELVLLLYGVVHTVFNAKKCGLMEDSFILDPKHLYLSHNSIQPYLMYLPTVLGMSLRDEFLALLSFLDGTVDPSITNTKKLVSVLRTIATDDFDMSTIIHVVVQAANKNIVEAPKSQATPVHRQAASVQQPDAFAHSTDTPAQQRDTSAQRPDTPTQQRDTSAQRPDVPPRRPDALQPVPKSPTPARKSAPPTPDKGETKKGFFARFFGWGAKEKEEEDFLPSIDDRTMIDFTAYGDGEGQPMLYVIEGNSRTGQIPVTSDAFVLGRNRAEVDFCFDSENDKGISRVHAAIIYDGNSYFVTDKGSAGGTFVDGVRLAPGGSAQLKNGNVISLYKKQLLFEITE